MHPLSSTLREGHVEAGGESEVGEAARRCRHGRPQRSRHSGGPANGGLRQRLPAVVVHRLPAEPD
eukprot:5878073-Prymnesium_polylepis.1